MMVCKEKTTLTWVRGNDVNLTLWLYENVTSDDNEQKREPFDFLACESIEVALVSAIRRTPVQHEAGEDANALVLRIPHTLSAGRYGIEVKAVMAGTHIRSFECGVVAIVNDNAMARPLHTRVGGLRATAYDVEILLTPAPPLRPLNPWELYREENPDATFDDFLKQYATGVQPAQATSRRLSVRVRGAKEYNDGDMLWVKVNELRESEELRLGYLTKRLCHVPEDNLVTTREAKTCLGIDIDKDVVENAGNRYYDAERNLFISNYGVYSRRTEYKLLPGVTLEPIEPAASGYTSCRLIWDGVTRLSPIVYYEEPLDEDGRWSLAAQCQFFGAFNPKLVTLSLGIPPTATLRNIAFLLTDGAKLWTPEKGQNIRLFLGQNAASRKKLSWVYVPADHDDEAYFNYRGQFCVCLCDRETGEVKELVPFEITLSYLNEDGNTGFYGMPVAVVTKKGIRLNYDLPSSGFLQLKEGDFRIFDVRGWVPTFPSVRTD